MSEELVSINKGLISDSYEITIGEDKILALNAQPNSNSYWAGIQLCENRPFSLVYYFSGKTKKFEFTLHSKDGKDVGEIAKKFGGQGTNELASFSLSLEQVDSFFNLLGI